MMAKKRDKSFYEFQNRKHYQIRRYNYHTSAERYSSLPVDEKTQRDPSTLLTMMKNLANDPNFFHVRSIYFTWDQKLFT